MVGWGEYSTDSLTSSIYEYGFTLGYYSQPINKFNSVLGIDMKMGVGITHIKTGKPIDRERVYVIIVVHMLIFSIGDMPSQRWGTYD